MSLVQINWRPGPRELRSFGLVIAIGFGLIGLAKLLWPWEWGLERSVPFALTCFAIAAAVGGAGLTGTRLALPFYWGWMGVAFVLGNVISRVVMCLFYYGVITPLGLLMRLTGRDKLQLRRRPVASYWVNLTPPTGQPQYERQF